MDSVASRYAIALLNIAREERKIKEYVDEVEQLGKLLSQNKDLLTLLKDYGLSTIEKKNLLTSIFENTHLNLPTLSLYVNLQLIQFSGISISLIIIITKPLNLSTYTEMGFTSAQSIEFSLFLYQMPTFIIPAPNLSTNSK